MELARAFGERVRELRTRRGMTQQKLGEAADVNYKYLGSIERGSENPTLLVIGKLAGALGVRPAEMLEFDHVENDANVLRERNGAELAEADVEPLRVALRMIGALLR